MRADFPYKTCKQFQVLMMERYSPKVTDDPLYRNFMSIMMCIFGKRDDGKPISADHALNVMEVIKTGGRNSLKKPPSRRVGK